MHTHFEDGSWQGARARYKQSTAVPSSLLVPSLSSIRNEINEKSQAVDTPGPTLPQFMEETPIPQNILSETQIGIIRGASDAIFVVQKIRSREWGVEEVVEAHLRMAAIAQQALGCYSTIFFDRAREQAKDLDRRIAAGEDCGRLCGLPISVKAHIAVEDTGSDRGFIFDILEPREAKRLLDEEDESGAKKISKSVLNLLRKQGDHVQKTDASHIKPLLAEGAIVIAKTVMPQSVMQLDTYSNLHGQTLNPCNLHLSPGGSSGGESASVAAGATLFGIGTDIGGSVRNPAAVTGLYGMRPTIGRFSVGGTRSTMLGNEGIIGTAGPLCRSLRDLKLVMEIMVNGTLDVDPFLTPPLPWKSDVKAMKTGKKLRVGVMRHDNFVRPITPIRRALKDVLDKLKQEANTFELVEVDPADFHAKGWALTRELYFMDNAELIRALASITGEPIVPLTEYILSAPVRDHNASECWELQYTRESFKRQYWQEVWVKNHLDVLLCPASHLCAPRPGQIFYWGYTSFFNLLELPGAVFPVNSFQADNKADMAYEKSESNQSSASLSALDEETLMEYETHRDVFQGAPVGLQLIGKRFREEELLAAMELIEQALK